MNEKVNIELTKEQSIVLFEFLSRFSDQDNLTIEHPSEEKVLLEVTQILEKKLSEPFLSEYGEILKLAREKIQKFYND